MQRHTFSREKTCIASMRKEKKADEVQRYTIPRRKTRVATRGKTRRRATVQRYTISGREPCIASIERGRSTDAVQRYPIFDRKTCIANMNNGRRPCTVQRHTFSQEKTCIASTEREKKADVMQRHTFSGEKACITSMGREKKTNRSHTTLHNTIRSSHKTKPHLIISHHITTISKHDNTTNRQNPIPCLKHHTLQHYTTKSSSPKNRRKSFIDMSANRLSQQSFEATRAPKRGLRRRGWRRLTP